ncbi:metallophosphoesterase [Geoalkalibacter halelectricus]|uniref:Metallophosphoesterase n=1 Tax=Geoalkalibacter halelectricus TaxID=2847045 RepID=A0ABY5ZKW3_9BACT|nr:metallophosphoesterase [Geoalkalibacter halelectricus]MDO3377199.1 metallophosphoesterase [Geoalkalibacter halelectricus]UWZ79331.1 metallophosphoesterase [Geoalkalibacter halelectricus]
MAYDLIGDIHGQVDELVALLEKLGYEKKSGAYRHSERRAIFAGDYIDRGESNRLVIETVRAMVDAGSALAVMGNHEYNAICFHTRHPDTGEYLRPHSEKNIQQHQRFLDEFSHDPAELKSAIAWFMQLPIYLDLGSLRVVHACWHKEKIAELQADFAQARLSEELLFASSRKKSQADRIIEALLKGPEADLPEGVFFFDKDGHKREEIRTRWWQSEAGTFRDAALYSEEALSGIPEEPFPAEDLIGYATSAAPVFFGHYWLRGRPSVFRENIACIDYSVAELGGSLCCYRWNGEDKLSDDNFVTVSRRN